MKSVRCWQVDAFTDRPFSGNPAAVCWLEDDAETTWMQNVAAEMNLSETAFVRRRGDALDLRWFTPTMEVDLCGHATLATAHALLSAQLVDPLQPIKFQTRSGLLTCTRREGLIELDFPATPSQLTEVPDRLIEALGVRPVHYARSRFYVLAVVESADIVRRLQPDFHRLQKLPTLGVIVTARSDDVRYDFISRFFAPAMGVNEDPVCGSAHCCLTPYWAGVLGKNTLTAFQASSRGGVLHLRNESDRVILGGQAVTVWQGEFFRPD